MAQMVKNLPAMWETLVRSLRQEDPLKKRMATHSSILAWRILQPDEPSSLQPIGPQRVRHNQVTNTFTGTSIILTPEKLSLQSKVLSHCRKP